MTQEQVVFPLAPVYKRKGIIFHQAKAVAIHPEGTQADERPQVEIVFTEKGREGETRRLAYDYLINATGPRLNFDATPGLGPDEGGHSLSVCTAAEPRKVIEAARAGKHQRLVIGTGNGTCTCQGAAFEYAFNVDFELREAGVRDRCEVVYLTNEAELGDFGVGGMRFRQEGYQTTS
ncbi:MULTISPECIES: hypothetical protein [unclassified Actinomyces]|uniref:hypothetical protein n=1 Tax=unclassified Actinomyces TaxID=2609248 RepID=UPI002017861C|nr:MULTISPECIES: hypothetical protein [unclassified Actinomyces]